MKYIISGTNRPNSRTRQVSNLIQKLYAEAGEQVEILDLTELPFEELTGRQYGGPGLHLSWEQAVQKVTTSDGLIFVVPEYNGSMPGALKYFIDHWKYPESFEYRPVCFVGLGGLFGGLRPIEHLQQVMAYRNAYQFPIRIFLMNVFKTLKDGELLDSVALQLLKDQVKGFQRFAKALRAEELDANTVNSRRPPKA
ncbi:MAG: NADPH-dependent FMN reductase [Pseudobdellovibrionaceae bacterium]